MAFDPQEMRNDFYSMRCAVCLATVGSTGTFLVRREQGTTHWFGPFCPTHRRDPIDTTETILSVGAQVDKTIDFLASPEGIAIEEEFIRPAVAAALTVERKRQAKKKKGGA